MLKYITWNNKIRFLMVFVIIAIFTIVTREPADILLNYLEDKYNKKFEIVLIGKRSGGEFYQARVYPKELEKLGKVSDEYYWFDGFVRGRSANDNYSNVLLQLSANKYFLPKLEELFGKNVLPILKIDKIYSPKFTDFKKELVDIKKTKELYNIDKYFPISGGIYIFGRVENDKDREWYRKQIYEFVQFMKQTGTFEYVDLAFYISDERLLSDEFQNNKNLQNALRELGEEVAVKERKEILSKVNESYRNTSLESRKKYLENMNKSNIRNEIYVNFWLYTKIYSKKYIESNLLDSEKKEYDKLEDIEFSIADY